MMTRFKHVASALVICSLLYSSSDAKTYTQKTFLAPRMVGFNSAMEYTTWHEHVYKKRQDKSLRSHLSATGFYQSSQNNSGLAKYFGAGDPCDCPIRQGFIVGSAADVTEGKADIQADFLVDAQAVTGGSPLRGEACFSPEQDTCGIRLDYFQDVTHPFKGLYFKASLPIVNVRNSMNLNIKNSKNVTLGSGTFSLGNFLAGNLDNSDFSKRTPPATTDNNKDMLLPLKKAKICGKRNTTSTADLDLALGYKLAVADNHHFFGHVAVTVPLGTRVRGEYLFEPVAGNGRHWGLGLGIDAGAQLWKNKRAAMRFVTSLNYKYLFENCEMRTIGIDPCAANGNKLGHYIAIGKKGQIGKRLQPAANILTQQVTVRPGHMFDGLVALSFNSSRFTLDVGYNLFFKDDENINLKKSKLFEDDMYGLANAQFDTETQELTAERTITGRFLKTSDLDLDAAKTPWQLTHKLFAGIGYTAKIYKKNLMSAGIGASYEFTIDNAALENGAFWGKIAFSF